MLSHAGDDVLSSVVHDVPELPAWSAALASFRDAALHERVVPGLTTELALAAIELALAMVSRGAVTTAQRVLEVALDLLASSDVAESPLETAEAIEVIAEELLALHALLGDRAAATHTLERCRVALLRVGTDA